MQEIHILLVDDNEGDVLLTREALAEAKIVNRISVAYDGVQALRFLKKEPPFMEQESPDLILLDINLPRMDGTEVLGIIKSDPELSEVCLTTTDTVFREEEFSAFIAEFAENKDLEGQMAVTAFIDDESPLYVAVDGDDRITAFTDDNSTDTPFVSGGIYCLRRRAIETVNVAVENGVSRMRNFQRQLVADGLHLKAYPFTKIVDVDHVSDIQTAELFLSGEVVY